MADKLPWFPFYVSAWMTDSDVLELSGEQMGAYLWLLCLQWQQGSLPYEAHRVIPMVPRNVSEVAITFVLLKFFPPDPDTNERRNTKLAAIRDKQLSTYEIKVRALEAARKSKRDNVVSDDRPVMKDDDRRSNIFISSLSVGEVEGGVGGEVQRGLADHSAALKTLRLLLLKMPSEAKRYALLTDVRKFGPNGTQETGTWADVADGFLEAVKSSDKPVPPSNFLAACIRTAKAKRLEREAAAQVQEFIRTTPGAA